MPPTAPALGLAALTRTILYSDDFERDVAWYQRVLGLRLAYPAEGGWAEFEGGSAGALCLHEGRAPGAVGPGHFACGWRVEDLDQAQAALAREGVATRGPRAVCEGLRCVEFCDPSGNPLFLEGR